MRERPYQKLIAWQEAHKLCVAIYNYTKLFPKDERFGLISQMRRSSASVPTNIAEGNGKSSTKEQRYYLETSMNSLEELHYQCLLSKELQYISVEQFSQIENHINRVSYLLMKFRKSLL